MKKEEDMEKRIHGMRRRNKTRISHQRRDPVPKRRKMVNG